MVRRALATWFVFTTQHNVTSTTVVTIHFPRDLPQPIPPILKTRVCLAFAHIVSSKLLITMASTQVDTRNLEWKDNNVGSKLLQKMGWKDGEGIGKRRLLKSDSNVSSEGLRVKRRAEGLGLGASSQMAQQSISHAADFAQVLHTLQEEHAGSDSDKKKQRKRKKSKSLVVSMPTNKSTHAKVRQAKFQEKTADDMKCIFASDVDIFAAISSEADDLKKKRKRGDADKAGEKKRKKDKKEGKSKKNKE